MGSPQAALADFSSQIAVASSDLSSSHFASALASATMASTSARTPLQRASAAVIRLGALDGLGRTSDALALVASCAGPASATAASHDLVLASVDIAVGAGEGAVADTVLRTWVEAREAEGGEDARDAEVVRRWVRVVGRQGAGEVLSRAGGVLGEGMKEVIEREVEGGSEGSRVTEASSPVSDGSRASDGGEVTAVVERRLGGVGLPRSGAEVKAVVERLGWRLRMWVGERGGGDQRVAVIVAVVSLVLWTLTRARGGRPSLLRVIRASWRDVMGIVLGRAGRQIRG